jgi:hypothetical protein
MTCLVAQEILEVCSICEATGSVELERGALATPLGQRACFRRGGQQESWPHATTGMGKGPAPAHRAFAHANGGACVVDAENGLLRQHRNAHRSDQLSLGRHEASRAPGPTPLLLPAHHGGLWTLPTLRAGTPPGDSGHGILRGHSFPASLLLARGFPGLDVRLDRHLPSLPSVQGGQTSGGDRPTGRVRMEP